MVVKELFAALEDIEREKGIPADYMLSKITAALVTAYKKDNAGAGENVSVHIDKAKKSISVLSQKTVVETVEDKINEISLEDAREISKKSELEDVINVEVKTKDFGRIAAQAAKQVIIQGLREAEREMVYEAFNSKEHEVLSGTVSRFDDRNGNVILELGGRTDKVEAVLAQGERIAGEDLKEGSRVKVYLVEVRQTPKAVNMTVSRTHPGLVRRLFELETPEIHDGIVEIKSIAREAGSRTKMAVHSNNPEVEPIGACVGPKGQRVNAIVAELGGEKIDIIKYSDDPEEYISAALAPSETVAVRVSGEEKSCTVFVPDDQLSLAIGKEGQNARLAAKLTGYKIDIKPVSQA